MLRFILIRKQRENAPDGGSWSRHFTIDCNVPELERALSGGGLGEWGGYEITELVGVEVIPDTQGG